MRPSWNSFPIKFDQTEKDNRHVVSTLTIATKDEVASAVEKALKPGCFFVAPGCKLHVRHESREEIPWELFAGHLLDKTKTRLRKSFESWNIHFDDSVAPVISVRYDQPEGRIHVTRNILTHVWAPYGEQRHVIQTRETRRWLPELIGTIELSLVADRFDLQQQVSRLVLLAVVGTSRLPTSSLQTPLPQFSLGQLGYFPALDSSNVDTILSDPLELLGRATDASVSSLERARLLEMSLRACETAQVSQLATSFVERWREAGLAVEQVPSIVKTLFNHIALSPYTGFVDRLILMLHHWSRLDLIGPVPVIDMLSFMLRHLARHLTAFDLVTFHNLGAEYADALLLDAMLKAYLALIDDHLSEFELSLDDSIQGASAKRLRRRALRQAWLIRRHCEGHRVPDLPTSLGENRRVLPEPFGRIAEEQILHPDRRSKSLFAGDSSQLLTDKSRRILEQSLSDLEHNAELRELGMATFLDRPLGIFKHPSEVDRTPLLTYEAFSRQKARSRLDDLCRWGLISSDGRLPAHIRRLEQCTIEGIPVARLGNVTPDRVVALEDAQKSAADFLFLRTTRCSLNDFLEQYDFEPLKARFPDLHRWLFSSPAVLFIRDVPAGAMNPRNPVLTAFDKHMSARIEIGVGQESLSPVHYVHHAGVEYVKDGLRLLSVGGGRHAATRQDLRDQCIVMPSVIDCASR